MKKSLQLFIFLVLFSISSCKKDDDSDDFRRVPKAKNYDVTIHISLGGTTVSNTFYLPDSVGCGTHPVNNVPDAYIMHVARRTGEVLNVSGTNTASGGYTSVSIEVYLNGELFKSDGNYNASGPSSASISEILPN